MEKSLHRYMKLGTIAFMSYPDTMKGDGPIEESLKKIASDPYFTAVELSWIKDAAARARVKKLLDASLLEVCYGAQPRFLTTGLNINDRNEAGRQAALASLKAGVDEAYELGAKGLAFLSGKYDEATKEDSYRALLRSTEEVCAYAAERGNLRIELEIFDYDVDKKSLIGPTPYAKRFAEDVLSRHKNFGLLVDLSHFPLLHETVAESIYPIRDYITHAHIGNAVVTPGCDAYGDAHPRFGFPHSANGEDDAVEYLRALLDIGFLNEARPPVLSFEVKPFGDEDADAVLAGCKRFFDRVWARV